MTGVRKILSVSRLKLDQNNPRHRHTSSEKEALDVMIGLEQDSLLAIAKHILENGLNPSVTTIVYKNERNRFIVKDGNRRVTALKCLLNPDIIDDKYENVRGRFKKMTRGTDTSVFSKIDCVVFTDESEADKWVENNHQGPQDGRGHDPWDAIEKLRDKQNKGKVIPELNVLDYIEEHMGEMGPEPVMPIDILKRVVTAKEFKEWTGIKHTEDGMTVSIQPHEFDTILERVVSDSRKRVIDTRKLSTAEDRSRYIAGLRESLPTTHEVSPTMILSRHVDLNDTGHDGSGSPDSNASSEDPESRRNAADAPENEEAGGPSKAVMFENLNWNGLDKSNPKHQSLIEIANELRSISIKKGYKKYPLSTAFLIRAAYEQCMKLIIECSGQHLNESNQLSTLERQSIALVERLHNEEVVSSALRDSLNQIDKEDTRVFLNYNVHNPGIIKATPQQLESMASKGMRAFIQYTILELDAICTATEKRAK